jgi:hypothetical protein
VFGRLKQAGTDVAESLGLGAWNRGADRPGKTTERTVAMLGIAANFMSNEQILAVNNLNRQMIDLEGDAENRVKTAIGKDRVGEFFQSMEKSLSDIATHTKKTAENTNKPSGTNPVQGPH